MKIGYLHLDFPINGKKKVLDRETFVSLYLKSNKTLEQISRENRIPYSLLSNSIKHHLSEFEEEIKTKKYQNYSRYASNRPESHVAIRSSVKVDKEKLKSLISEGKSEWEISKIFNVAPQTIRKNVRNYKLKYPPQGLYRLSEQEWMDLEWLEQLSPGIIKAAFEGIKNPIDFFHKLYEAFIRINKILWTIQKLSGRYNHYRGKNRVPRDYISWRQNKQEIILSEELRSFGIDHIRDYIWASPKRYAADIFIVGTKIIIEIDGDIHNLDIIKSKDKEKKELALKLGYKRIVFSSKDVDRNLSDVMEKIKNEII